MIRKNFRSDFCFFLELYDAQGHKLAIPDYNFTIKVTTSGHNVFTAYRRGDISKGFIIKDDKILIVCDRHCLLQGTVKVSFEADIPSDIYPDGFEHIFRKFDTNILLTDKESDEDLQAMVKLALPIVNASSIDILPEASSEEIISSANQVFKP